MWAPLNCRTDYSILRAISKPEALAARCKELGYSACGVADLELLAGVPSFLKAMKKEGVRGIAGHEFYVCRGDSADRSQANRGLSRLLALGIGQGGWKDLVRLSSLSHSSERFYYRPRLSASELASDHLVAVSGFPGSTLGDLLFGDAQDYLADSHGGAKAAVKKGWDAAVRAEMAALKASFGDRFLVGVQLVDAANCPAHAVLAEAMRWAARKEGVRCVALAAPHYPTKEDAPDHRVWVATGMKKGLAEASRTKSPFLAPFFRSCDYHLPSPDEMAALHTPDELRATLDVAEKCGELELPKKILFPPFPLPEGETPDGKLRDLCREGWRKKLSPELQKDPRYAERIKHELAVLEKANLATYFLVTWDLIRYATEELGCVRSEGRGSAPGCLVSYLTGITDLDPIEHDLVFERFYSSSRNVPRHVSFKEAPFGKFEEPKEASDWKGTLTRLAARAGKLEALKANKHFLDELSLLDEPRVAAYYAHVVEKVDVDRENPQNSFLLYLIGKAEKVDPGRPAAIEDAYVSLPDIDNDFPKWARAPIIAYAEEKYGKDKVGHIATFGTNQGRGALTDVLRAHGRLTFSEIKKVTAPIPDRAKISDDLQEMAKAGGDDSTILWALEHLPDKLKEWCWLEGGKLEGPLAQEFGQAIRLEGTIRSRGKHASGIVIAGVPLAEVAPMIQDEGSERPMVGVDMRDAEDLGLVKGDILGVIVADRLQEFGELMRKGTNKL